jgi:hypothetical protein
MKVDNALASFAFIMDVKCGDTGERRTEHRSFGHSSLTNEQNETNHSFAAGLLQRCVVEQY